MKVKVQSLDAKAMVQEALKNEERVIASMHKGIELANQAQVDAKLAQSKASSVKAQAAADVLQDDIRVLREELDRQR